MKIRIIKKGLPKAQMWNSQPGKEMQLQPSTQQNYSWYMPPSQMPPAPAPAQPLMEQSNQGTPVQNQSPVMAIKQYKPGEWINANMSKFSYGVQKADNWLQNNETVQAIGKAGVAANKLLNVANFATGLIDQKKQNKALEAAYRDSLFNMQPVDYTANRGDYEQNTGMVDPYNTGAKSKGQFTNAFYPSQFQKGGPISYGDEPVRRVIGLPAPMPIESGSMPRAVASSTYVKPPVVQNFDLAPDFENYADKAQKYIKRVNPNTDITGDMLAAAAQDTFQKTGKIVPVELALAQLQQEGYLAKSAKLNKPQRTRNPFNVGNVDSGDVVNHDTLQSGINSYFKLMATQYLNKRTPEQLLENFVNSSGHRYASDKNYENSLKSIISNMSGLQDGGSVSDQTNSMKIIITQEPQANMAYGGQMGYGFDTGSRRIYTDMPESESETVSNTMGPVDRDEATIEAEKGETILSDVDDDGMMEHMTIGGKRHSEGGTPLAAKEGDFIFSDTKKMKIKDPEVLKMFGKSYKAGGITPANIAKQYDLNKYKAILQDPNTDAISKRTAERMLDHYNKKLGQLALLQESMKGFPQGIPDIAASAMPQAQFGGAMESYQDAGPVKLKSKQEFDAAIGQTDPVKGKWEMLGPNLAQRKWRELVKAGIEGQAAQFKTVPGKAPAAGSAAFNKAFADARRAGLKEFTFAGKRFNTGLYTPGKPQQVQVKPAVQAVDPVYKDNMEQLTFDEATPTGSFTPGPSAPNSNLDVPEFTPQSSNIPYGWTQQDKNNLALAGNNYASIRKYGSVRRDLNPAFGDFRNMDWRGKAAELQGTYNSQMNTLGTYGSPQSLAANASFMAGQQAENLINRAIDPTEQQNVQIYNQVANQNAGIMNQALLNNAQNTFLRSQDRAVLNQQYDNAKRDALKAITMTTNQGLTNAAGIYNTNISESPYYYFDPRSQKMVFNSNNAKNAYYNIKNASPNQGDLPTQAAAVYKSLAGLPEEVKSDYMKSWITSQFGTRGSSTTYPNNPKNNKTVMPMGYTPSSPWDQQY